MAIIRDYIQLFICVVRRLATKNTKSSLAKLKKYCNNKYSMFSLQSGQEVAFALGDSRHFFILRHQGITSNLHVYYLDRLETYLGQLHHHQGLWTLNHINKNKFPQFSQVSLEFQNLLKQLNIDWTVLNKSRYRYKCTKCRRKLRDQYWRSCGHGKKCAVEITKSNYQRFKERKQEKDAKEKDELIKKQEEWEIKQEESILKQI